MRKPKKISFALVVLFSSVIFAQQPEPLTLPEVVVEGKPPVAPGVYNSSVVSLPKYTASSLQTPQSVTILPAQIILDQGAVSLRELLRNVSGLSLAAGENGMDGDNFTIRGFSAGTDIFLDGLRSAGNYNRDPFIFEQVEVLKGPASTTFGRGSSGGVISLESKKPQVDPVTTASITAGTESTKRVTLDLNRAVANTSPNSYLRLNLMAHESDVAGRNAVENHRYGFSPSLGLGIGTSERTIISYYKQVNDDIPDSGIPFLFDKVADVDRSNFYGFKNANYLHTDVDIFNISYEKDATDSLTLHQQLRYGTYRRNLQETEAQVSSAVSPGTDINSINVDRSQIGVKSTETAINYELYAIKNFESKKFKHRFIFGIEADRETSDPRRYSSAGVPPTSLVRPEDSEFSGAIIVNSVTDIRADTFAGYIADTITLSEKWEWTEQIRYDYLESGSQQSVPVQINNSRIDNQMLSSRGALVYKADPDGIIYLTYSTSFNPSVEQYSLSSANAGAEPEKNRNYELGTKWSFLDGGLSLTSAIFINEKVNARTPDPANPTVNILAGSQKVQGWEIETSGALTPRWQIFAGYCYSDSEITDSSIASEKGSRLANAPLNTGSVWATYQLTRSLQLGGGVKAVSERIASITPDVASGLVKKVDGYSVFDAMAQYRYSNEINYRLNFFNLEDKFYSDGVQSGHSLPGAGRSARFTATVNF